MEQPLAHRVAIPSARIPSAARQTVAPVENLGALDAAKARHREERRRFHVNHDASLAPEPVHPLGCFAIDGVGGPGLAADVVMMVFAQRRLDRSERAAGGRHFACRPDVVMRGAFVANRGARHHDIANVDCAVQHSRAAANDELAASERDDALEARGGSGCTDPRMDHCETPAAVVELLNRVIAHLALASVEMARPCALARQFGDYLLEETQHAMLGDIDRLDDARGLDDRLLVLRNISVHGTDSHVSDSFDISGNRLISASLFRRVFELARTVRRFVGHRFG